MSNPHNRARRAKARRNKPYRPRPVGAPMLAAAELVMRPLERIVDRLEIDGMVDVDGRGVAVFQDGDGHWCDAAEGVEGLRCHFEMMGIRHGLSLPLDGLAELVTAFRYCVPVQLGTMVKLRAALPVLRKAMALGDPADQVDLLQQTRIKAELEARA